LLHTWTIYDEGELEWMIISINTTKTISAQIPVGVLLLEERDSNIENKTVDSFLEDFRRHVYEPRVEL
jgi:hypothetical protein